MTHRPNETNRRLVVALSSVGVQHDRIARMIGVGPGTLRGAYRAELDDGVSRAVAGAAENMVRIARKPTMAGYLAAKHVLNCHGGPAWRDVSKLEIEPGADVMAYLRGSESARDIIAAKLDQLAVRNAALGSESSH